MYSFAFLIIYLVAICNVATAATASKKLNVTVSAPVNGVSALECWQLSDPLIASTQSGTKGSMVAQLGDLTNASYSIIPKGTNGGLHTAPYPQYEFFLFFLFSAATWNRRTLLFPIQIFSEIFP